MVEGFRFAGGSCGIKRDGSPDLGLIVADEDVATVAVMTRNRVKAAPVLLAAERLERGRGRAILVNSGNANACTGKRGLEAARDTTATLADALEVDDELVLPASTGVIGVPLPVEKIQQGIPSLVSDLAPDGVERFAEAIMTTDRWPKVASVQISIGNKQTATVLGVAKGAGMIHPNMATTLAFVVTDAPMSSAFLEQTLRTATRETFNAITVDGETSPNDTIFAMASSRVDSSALRGEDRDARRFKDALRDVLDELGRSIVRDGEGAQKVVTVQVTGAPSEDAATQVAHTIAGSLLVKTAIHGEDPNWGRIISAAGNAGVAFDQEQVEIRFDKVVVTRKGIAIGPGAEHEAKAVMSQPEYTITVKLGGGDGSAHYVMCDIGAEYVRINANYRT